MKNRKTITKPLIYAAIIMAIFSCLLFACNKKDNADKNQSDSIPTDYIGQDKEAVGYYKRISIAKDGETYEEMKKQLEIMKKGYLVLKDDGTAFFELDGEITEYTFDKKNFYMSDDTKMEKGFPYTYINGSLIINDGKTVTQYSRLTDEELESYLKSSKEKENDR